MKEETVEDRVSAVADSGGSTTLAEQLLMQQTPVSAAAAAAASLLRQPDGSLLSQAALQAALMASLAAQQAHQLHYQHRLLGSTLGLGAHHALAGTTGLLDFQHQQQQQQREALLAWSKLAAHQAAYSSEANALQTPTSVNGATTTTCNSKLDDSGIQTSPKVDSTSNSSGSSGGAESGLLGGPFSVLNHHERSVSNGDTGSQVVSSIGGGSSGGDVTPSPPNTSPPSNGTSRGKGNKDGSREKVFVCQICNRSFGYKHVLQNHERTHTGEKPFECKECHKRFTRDHHLKTHMRLHTGEKPYHCSHCDRQFVQVANLRRHLRVHTGERPYACELCDSKFSDSNQLKAHMLIHKGEKPFRCEQCFGTYRRRHHLMHHRCTREPSHAALMSGLLGTADDETEIDSETRSDVSNGGRVKAAATMSAVSGTSAKEMVLHDTLIEADEYAQDLRRRGRKQKETRRVIRVPEQSSTVTSCYPEQTEPEDLSLHAAKRPSISSPEDDYKKSPAVSSDFAVAKKQTTVAIMNSQRC